MLNDGSRRNTVFFWFFSNILYATDRTRRNPCGMWIPSTWVTISVEPFHFTLIFQMVQGARI